MTPEQFLQRHGTDWNAIRRSELFPALVETLRSFDPSRAMPAVEASSATEHAQHLLGRIAGFNLAVNTLESGIAFAEPPQEPTESYQDEP